MNSMKPIVMYKVYDGEAGPPQSLRITHILSTSLQFVEVYLSPFCFRLIISNICGGLFVLDPFSSGHLFFFICSPPTFVCLLHMCHCLFVLESVRQGFRSFALLQI